MVEKVIPAIHLLTIIAISIVTMWLMSSKKQIPKMRKLPQLDGLDESLGRSVEMGRPVLYTIGQSTLHGWGTSAALAGFSILQYTAEQCVDLGAELLVSITNPQQIPIIEAIMEQAYMAAGKPGEYNPDNIIFVGGSQYSQSAALLALLDDRRPGGFIFPGGTGWSRVIFGEHASRVGAMAIAGIDNVSQIPYTVVSYDYTLICEDFLAAGAMLSGHDLQISNIWTGDIYRYILVALIIIGFVASTLGLDIGGLFNVS